MGEGEIEGEGTSEAAPDVEGVEAGETRGLPIFYGKKLARHPEQHTLLTMVESQKEESNHPLR